MEIIIKSKETKEGVCFRILKDDKFFFANIPFKNYFYIKKTSYEAFHDEFEATFRNQEVMAEGDFIKIIFDNNYLRNKIREFWDIRTKTYEADIQANKRFLIDRNIQLNNDKVPFAYFDIETDDRLPLHKDEQGRIIPDNGRILSYSSVNYKGEQFFIELKDESDDGERALIKEILNDLMKYGIVSGWNSEKFDMPYIKGRCDILGVNYECLDYVNHLDYEELIKKYDKKTHKSYSLNSISNYYLKESKLDQEKGNGAIYNTWKNNLEHLKRYNIEDSNLIYKMNKKLSYIEVSMKRANIAGCHVRNTFYNTDCGDFALLRRYHKRGIIMPSKPTKDEIELRRKQGKISGGFTRCLKTGFFQKVHVWDMKSEYPSTIMTYNISPETYVSNIEKDDEGKNFPNYIYTPSNFNEETQRYHPHRLFKKDVIGVFPEYVKFLIDSRDPIKYSLTKELKEKDPEKYKELYCDQYALKTDANSMYGILGDPQSRYYNWDVADSVTTGAQTLIKECYKKLHIWGCTVLGGDTDSTFVVLPETIDFKIIDYHFEVFFNEWFPQWNVDKHYMIFEHEKVFSPFLFIKKKNYAYKMDNEIVIKGLEAIKADSTIMGAQLQAELITEMLNNTYIEENWRKNISNNYIKVYNQELQPQFLILAKQLTKMPNDYKGSVIDKQTGKPKIKNDGSIQEKAIPAHVKLAERLLAQGKDLYPGSKIRYIVIHNKPIIAISPEEYSKGSGTFKAKFKKQGIIDYQWEGGYEASYYWTRIIKPLVKVLYCYHGKLPDMEFNLKNSEMSKILGDDEDGGDN